MEEKKGRRRREGMEEMGRIEGGYGEDRKGWGGGGKKLGQG